MSDPNCPICLEPLQPEPTLSSIYKKAEELKSNLRRGEKTVVTDCGHYYHKDCLQEWIDTPDGNRGCAICRREILSKISTSKVIVTGPPYEDDWLGELDAWLEFIELSEISAYWEDDYDSESDDDYESSIDPQEPDRNSDFQLTNLSTEINNIEGCMHMEIDLVPDMDEISYMEVD